MSPAAPGLDLHCPDAIDQQSTPCGHYKGRWQEHYHSFVIIDPVQLILPHDALLYSSLLRLEGDVCVIVACVPCVRHPRKRIGSRVELTPRTEYYDRPSLSNGTFHRGMLRPIKIMVAHDVSEKGPSASIRHGINTGSPVKYTYSDHPTVRQLNNLRHFGMEARITPQNILYTSKFIKYAQNEAGTLRMPSV